MRSSLAVIVGSLLFAASAALGQTPAPGAAPGTPAPGAPASGATDGGLAGWWWIILLVIVIAAAIWYFTSRRPRV